MSTFLKLWPGSFPVHIAFFKSSLSKKDRKDYFPVIFLLVFVTSIIISCNKDDNSPDPLKDIEGNTYKTIRIGTQTWMAENLKTTILNNGTQIPQIINSEDWRNLYTEGYCWYNNDPDANRDTYGALYNGFTVSTGELCPTGWHIPTREDWLTLREFLSDTINGGNSLKETGPEHWLPSNISADNSTGFSALPSGIRYFEGTFSSINSFTSFWSGTETSQNELWYISLYSGNSGVSMHHISKKYGFSVRCVKD
jgi:uncharacterized protein (TIGR02145 family)